MEKVKGKRLELFEVCRCLYVIILYNIINHMIQYDIILYTMKQYDVM